MNIADIPVSRRALLRAAMLAAATSSVGRAAGTLAGPLGSGTPLDPVGTWHALDLAATGFLSLPACLNGQEFRAMIDTGASRSIVRHDLALDLNLPYIGSVVATTFSDTVTGNLYRVDDLAVDAAAFRRVDVASYDLSQVEGLAGHRIPLILGQDVLRAIDLEVRFEADQARFLSPHQSEAAGFERIGLQGAGRKFPCLPIRLERHISDRAILDLGSDAPLSMSIDFARHFDLLRDRPVSTTLSYGADGTSVNRIITVQDVQIGPFSLREVPTCVVENWEMAEPVAIGWPALSRLTARISLARDLLSLQGDMERVAMPFPKDRSGLGCQRLADLMMVRHVAMNSPAGRAGLREGDQIVAINGQAVGPGFPHPGERFGFGTAGSRLKLSLSDGRIIPLVLNDYF